jgi:hypothetical protein
LTDKKEGGAGTGTGVSPDVSRLGRSRAAPSDVATPRLANVETKHPPRHYTTWPLSFSVRARVVALH